MNDLTLDKIKEKEQKILSKIVKQPSGCWEWQAGRHNQGYAMMGIGKKKYFVHRLVMMLEVGRILEGDEHVCHHCDNPPCINPNHLFISDATGNMADKDKKGRANVARGEKSGRAILTKEQVIELRNLYLTGKYSFKDLAERVGLSVLPVHQAITGRAWKHVPGPFDEIRKLAQSRDRLKDCR